MNVALCDALAVGLCVSGLLLLPGTTALGQDAAPEQPPVPQFQTFPANATLTTGKVRLLYIGQSPDYYFSLSSMPERVEYFRVKVNGRMAMHKLKLIQLAAEHDWEVGVYHQPRTTENIVDAYYVIAAIAPKPAPPTNNQDAR